MDGLFQLRRYGMFMAPRGLNTATLTEQRDGALRLSATFRLPAAHILPSSEQVNGVDGLKGYLVGLLNQTAAEGYPVATNVFGAYRPQTGQPIQVKLVPGEDFDDGSAPAAAA